MYLSLTRSNQTISLADLDTAHVAYLLEWEYYDEQDEVQAEMAWRAANPEQVRSAALAALRKVWEA